MEIVTCKAGELSTIIDGDLDDSLHEGFTVGERGKVMYWYFIWHGGTTGNATIYSPDGKKSYITPDQIINIHFKNQ